MKSWTVNTHRSLLALFAVFLVGCGAGNTSSNTASNAEPETYVATQVQENSTDNTEDNTGDGLQAVVTEQTVTDIPVTTKVTVRGAITYDRVPFGSRSYDGLDYDAAYTMPARAVTVQALNATDTVLFESQTNDAGEYSFTVDQNAEIKIRVVAELLGAGSAAWDIQVKDNTSGNAVYVLEGSLASVGSNTVQTRNLHAKSGWEDNSYTQPRSAAPFAILDSVYDAVKKVVSADNHIVLPPLSIYWSVNNIAISGRTSDGNIGTSYFTSYGPSIYLLGAANNDSDEYDRAVIQHEFGHYLEHQIGRTESIGGSHSQNSKLDMRVAFGEAWGNAFSAMVGDDPLYRDSLGASQSLGFTVDVERKSNGNQGWFSEASIQGILYDVYDANSDSGDNVNLGFKAIYDVFVSQAYLDFAGMASIYPFVAQLKAQNPSAANDIASLVESYEIYGTGWWGEGEVNDAGSDIVLPLYHTLSPGEETTVCSDSDYQEYNGVDVRRFIRVNLPSSGSYRLSATRNGGGITRTNPQLRVFSKGNEVSSSFGSQYNYESISRTFNAGEYILEVYEEANADNANNTGGLACFSVTVE